MAIVNLESAPTRWRLLMGKLSDLLSLSGTKSFDALIVVAPGANLEYPAIGPHLLAARAREEGFRVSVLYANMMYAAVAGVQEHQLLCSGSEELWGERVFAKAAYGTPLLGRNTGKESNSIEARPAREPLEQEELRRLAELAGQWADQVSGVLAEFGPRVIGCSTMFLQTAASVALLSRIKSLTPERIAIMGGPNCEGEMAEGMLTLSDQIDFTFSGESEQSFPTFLHSLRNGSLPERGVISGTPMLEMDKLPPPEYSEYYEQLELFLPDSEVQRSGKISLPYETSRGCWWGEKHHCTFCGLNGYGMKFRSKSPARAIDDLRKLLVNHPTRRVQMVDNIMPHTYFKSFLPLMESELPNLQIFYEQKSNLSLDQVRALRRAGVDLIQPGIESLSTALLKRMKKGVSARQNINLLRYSRSVGVTLMWNILYGFPGDLESEYETMIGFVAKLQHLNPPSGVFSVCVDRFSPYFTRPEEFGVSNLQPSSVYASFLPETADARKVAYQFTAEFESESLQSASLAQRLRHEVAEWRKPWLEGPPPVLELTELSDDAFMLLDTRQLSEANKISFLNRTQAAIALTGFAHPQSADLELALERGWVIELDGLLVPLATAEPELLSAFEAELSHARARTSKTIPILQPIPAVSPTGWPL